MTCLLRENLDKMNTIKFLQVKLSVSTILNRRCTGIFVFDKKYALKVMSTLSKVTFSYRDRRVLIKLKEQNITKKGL
jgi:hypothetical protein